MEDVPDKPRWQYRFDNFSRSLARLEEGRELLSVGKYPDLTKEGFIYRFESTLALSFKVMKDYFKDVGIKLDIITPFSIIEAAAAHNLVPEADIWKAAIHDRNIMVEMILDDNRDPLVHRIESHYLPLFRRINTILSTALAN